MSERARLLYVEDDAGLARLLSKGLAAHDINLTHVETCAQALDAIGRETFDVIALDHNLSGETGLDLLEALKDHDAAPPVIYVTGSDDARVAVAALKAGAVDYVWKDTAGHYRELLAQAVGAALDQQKLKDAKAQAEHALREAKDRLEILLAEVNHRIANSLTLISSLTRLQANAIDDPACKAALTETQARVLAIAGVHKHLYSNALSDVRRVEFSSYLRALVSELAASMTAHQGTQLRMDAPPQIYVKADDAVSLGIIASELITNAYKYAYDDGIGEIRVIITSIGDNKAALSVQDDGKGWTGTGAVSGTGVGSKVISALTRSLQTDLVYLPGPGTHARVTFEPLTEI